MSARCPLHTPTSRQRRRLPSRGRRPSSSPPSSAGPLRPRRPPLTPPPGRTGPSRRTPAGVVSRSDVFLGQPNTADSQSLPLGNGSLGVAAWAANGFTAQLNRSDTMPYRLSPGQVQIPGLAAMTSASNFTGTLDLYNGVLNESGGGMTLQAWVPAGKDELIVERHRRQPEHAGDRRPEPVERALPDRGRVRRDRQPRPDLGGQLPDRQRPGRPSARWPRSPRAGRTSPRRWSTRPRCRSPSRPNSNGSFRVVIASPDVDRRQRDHHRLDA